MNLKPLVKWAGGKRQIMNRLLEYFPHDFGNYYEPFLGGGSVFMELYNRGILKNRHVYLSDIMEPLITLYTTVKESPDQLLKFLSENYTNSQFTAEYYYNYRDKFNILKFKSRDDAERIEYACLFLYLNRLGFNGMYRENSKGLFNVPHGKHKNPCIYNEHHIQELSNVLNSKDINIKCSSYEEILSTAQQGDFIYMDPPYYGTFSQYNKDKFDMEEHVKLHNLYKELSSRGCKVAMSNSDNDFIRNLYSDIPNIRFIDILSTRMINCNIEDRMTLKNELLIVNYTE